MNEPPPAVPADQSQQPQAAPLYVYSVRLMNGEYFEISSPLEWIPFFSVIARDRYISSPGGFIPYHAIGSIVPKGPRSTAPILHLVTTPRA